MPLQLGEDVRLAGKEVRLRGKGPTAERLLPRIVRGGVTFGSWRSCGGVLCILRMA
jgi:hypothetical protein